MHALQGRWAADARAAVPTADEGVLARTGRDLTRRWAEPHRRYHGPTHLDEVLAAVDVLSRALRLGGRERSVAVLGAWFHDAVYAVDAPEGNERASARLAVECLSSLGADDRLVDDVATVVLDTAAHELDPDVEDPARLVLHDADLWVLAAPTPRFDEYCAQVRSEYGHVTAGEYAAARSAVLRPFLARENLYRTEHARERWGPAARENLARELTRLAG